MKTENRHTKMYIIRRLSMQLIHAHKITNIKYNDSSPEKLNDGETILFYEYRQVIDRRTLGNNYPDLNYMSNTEQKVDKMLILHENPNLRKTTFLSQTLNFWTQAIGGNLSLDLSHRSGFHEVRNITLLENNNYIQTYSSGGNCHLLTAQISYSKKIEDKFQFKFSGTWNRRINTNCNPNCESDWTASGNIIYFYKAFYWGLSRKTVSNTLSSNGYRFHHGAGLNIYSSYNKDHFSLLVGYNNPFWKSNRRTTYMSDLYSSTTESFNDRLGKFVYIRLSWNMSFGTKHNIRTVNIDKNSNSAILDASK